MSRAHAKFTQTDLERAIRAVKQSGAAMEVVLETDGTIRLIPGREPPEPEKKVTENQQVDYGQKVRL
jgi:hypothetical protein